MDAGSSSTVNSDVANAFASQFEGMSRPSIAGFRGCQCRAGAHCDTTWQWQPPTNEIALTPHHRGRPRHREPRQERQALRSWLPPHANGCQPSRVHAPHDGRWLSPIPRLRYETTPATNNTTLTSCVDQQRMGGPQRHHSVSEYDGSRSHSTSNVQSFYQNQRYAPRPNDADQMAQAKRRMAAQRERELRNYHQEQQYHRSKDSESGQQ
jgi:hypothetical protein